MALVAGSQYDVFTADQVVNFGFVFDQGPNVDPASLSVPPPVPGAYNLEVEIVDRQPFLRIGLNVIDGPAPGYQGTALLLLHQPADLFGGLLVNKFAALHGDYGVVDTGGNGWISAGDGNVSILGASGDTLYGGAGNSFLDAHLGNQLVNAGNGTIWGGAGDTIYGLFGNVTIGGGAGDTIYGSNVTCFIDASLGNQSVVGGDAGSATIWGGAGDTIVGGAGNVTIGGGAGDTITGGSNYFIDASLGNQSVVGGPLGNGTIWGGAGDTIVGGAGSVTIGGGAGDTITGGSSNYFIDASLGFQSIAGGAGNGLIWGGAGDTIQGASGSGSAVIAFGAGRIAGQQQTLWDNGNSTIASARSSGNDTVVNFTQLIGDRISLSSADPNANTVVAGATQDGSGNAVLHLNDGSSITLIGVAAASLDTGFFTTH